MQLPSFFLLEGLHHYLLLSISVQPRISSPKLGSPKSFFLNKLILPQALYTHLKTRYLLSPSFTSVFFDKRMPLSFYGSLLFLVGFLVFISFAPESSMKKYQFDVSTF